jgi:hypothetical protein
METRKDNFCRTVMSDFARKFSCNQRIFLIWAAFCLSWWEQSANPSSFVLQVVCTAY